MWILATALFGLTFIGGQVYEFTEFYREGLHLSTQPLRRRRSSSSPASTARTSTVGIFWLLSLWARSMQGQLGQEQAEAVEIAGLYWHFVDVVWIVIFTAVYLVPQTTEAPT